MRETSRKKELSLEDVRRDPKLLDKFIKQQPKRVDKERFEALLKGVLESHDPDNPEVSH